MPIKTVSGKFRPPRLAKIRLGYKKKGGDYPKDTDVFIGRPEDGVTPEMLQAYDKGLIEEAEGKTHNLGKSLRMLTYFEWDARNPETGDEIVVNLLNRAWSATKIRCSGTGGDSESRGEAFTRDEAYRDAIAKATKVKPRERKGGWDVVCYGTDCPMWHSNQSTNKNATCHHELRFLAQLLDPATNPEDPKYLKNYGSVEIVSGSFNGMVDVQSGLQLLRSVAGRSANVPFSLLRKPRTVLVAGKRVSKATLMVSFDNDEAIRFGYTDPQLALVRPAIRKQLMANKREMLQLAQMEVGIDSVRDIVPRLEAPASSESGRTDYPLSGSPTGSDGGETSGGSAREEGPAVPDSSTSVVADRDQVLEEAAATDSPQQLSDEELNRALNQGERDELKLVCGGIPGDRDSLAHFRELATLALKDLGDWKSEWDPAAPPFGALKLKHAIWIREAIEVEKGGA